MKITSCKTNHIENPLGFHMDEAVVSWITCDTKSGKQKSARIIVGLDSSMQTIVYDSGDDNSLDSRGVALPIKLLPTTRYYWAVTIVGDKGDTATSDINWFETAKMDTPWVAKWITPPWMQYGDYCRHPYMRKQFAINKNIVSARAYISGLGIYELYINGKRIGNEHLTPYCNTYDAWMQYQTFDITKALQQQENAVGVMLANGWAKGRFGTFRRVNVPYTYQFSLICEIHVSYEDGSTTVISTGDDWLCNTSPILFDNIYDGVVYDANLEIPGWCSPGLNETGWEYAKCTIPSDIGPLMARLSLPVKIMEEITPIAIIQTPAGETVLDMGQNMVGWVRMRVNEPKGTKITISHGEIMQKGVFFNENLRSAKAEYVYISDGTPQEIEPRFTFYGFRYIKVEGVSAVNIKDFTGCVLYSDLETVGSITTSDERVNKLFQNVIWGQKGNFLDVPTDCNQRDERMGWTGDTQIFAGTAMFNMSAYPFYVKFMHDLYEEQKLCGGLVPSVVPIFVKARPTETGWTGGGCAWSDCATVVPWETYLHTGDVSILKKQYQSMKSWVDWITKTCKKDGTGYLWTEGFQFGDWLALDGPAVDDPVNPNSRYGGTDTGYLASAYYKLSSQLVSKAAEVLGHEKDANAYRALANAVKDAIRQQYFADDGRLKIQTQTAHVVALHFDLADNKSQVIQDLNVLLEKNNMHLQTGFIGTPYLCRSLSDNGASDNAYRLFFNDDYPSWLYPISMGATTIWERWNSVLPNGELSDTTMNSLNHYAYGSIAEWMYRNMCGINPVESAPGFKEILLKPEPNPLLSFARAEVKTAMGYVKCGWKYNGDNKLTIEVEVPFNTKAVLHMPNSNEKHELSAGLYTFTCYSDFV